MNDASTDGSMSVLEKARAGLEEAGVKIIVGETELKNKGTGRGFEKGDFIFFKSNLCEEPSSGDVTLNNCPNSGQSVLQ